MKRTRLTQREQEPVQEKLAKRLVKLAKSLVGDQYVRQYFVSLDALVLRLGMRMTDGLWDAKELTAVAKTLAGHLDRDVKTLEKMSKADDLPVVKVRSPDASKWFYDGWQHVLFVDAYVEYGKREYAVAAITAMGMLKYKNVKR